MKSNGNSSMTMSEALSACGEFLTWECPECGVVCSDPNDFRSTLCDNGHAVILGHDRGNGWQDAYLEENLKRKKRNGSKNKN